MAQGGWLVAIMVQGCRNERHALVACESGEDAFTAAQKHFGANAVVMLRNPADAVHFKRRGIKGGEVFELGNISTHR